MSPVNGTVVSVKGNVVGIMLPTTIVMYTKTNLPLKRGDKIKVTIDFDNKTIGTILGDDHFDNSLRMHDTHEWVEDPILDLTDEVLGYAGTVTD